MPPHPLVWGVFGAPNVCTVRTPSKPHATPLSTLLEIDNLDQSTLSVLKRDQTPYVVDLLAIIQLLPVMISRILYECKHAHGLPGSAMLE